MSLNDAPKHTTPYERVCPEAVDKAIKHALANENSASQSQPQPTSVSPPSQPASLHPQSQPGSDPDPYQSDSIPSYSVGFRGNVQRDRHGRFIESENNKNHPKSGTQVAANKVAANVTKWKQAAVRNMKKIQKARFCHNSIIHFSFLITMF